MPYKSRRSGLTGNQLKIIGIAAVLIDNIGAVVIQRYILMEAGTMGRPAACCRGRGPMADRGAGPAVMWGVWASLFWRF